MSDFISRRLSRLTLIAVVCSVAIIFGQAPARSVAASNPGVAPEALRIPDLSQLPDLIVKAQQNGTVPVVVSLWLNNAPLKIGSNAEMQAQQLFIQQSRSALVRFLSGHNVKVNAGLNWVIPAIALTVDSSALQQLAQSPLVSSISADHESVVADQPGDAVLGVPATWSMGYTGLGQSVAILDTGVQRDHPFLGNRIAIEACFSASLYSGDVSLCPNGLSSQLGIGAAAPCVTYCDHGTHVAGIAAGNGLGFVGYAGVAINAGIVAVQIFHYNNGSVYAYDSDIISGLNYVYQWYWYYNVAAVNLSLGSNQVFNDGATCDAVDPNVKTAIDVLRSVNVATVIAAGNGSSSNGISWPGCISSAISVGAVDNYDAITSFSNSGISTTGASMPTLLAPGNLVWSSIPGSSYAQMSGTSMATPYVVGAIAVLKSEKRTATVDQLLGILKNTGRLITDPRNQSVAARVQVDAAATAFVPKHKTIGVFRNNTFFLRNSNTTGVGDETVPLGFGTTNYPVVGDWTGSGVDRVGIYDQSSGQFTLCVAADSTFCAYTQNTISFTLGVPGDQPIAGRWAVRDMYIDTINGPSITNTPTDGVGVFRPSNGLIYLKSSLSTGFADYVMVLGIPGDVGIFGDWNGDGVGSPGVYRPSNSIFFLSNSICGCSVTSDTAFIYGNPFDTPVIGDWLGSPTSQGIGIGLYRRSDGYFYLRDTLNTGYATNWFYYGIASDIPVSGRWLASLQPASASNVSGVNSAPPWSILVPSSGGMSGGIPSTPIPALSHD